MTRLYNCGFNPTPIFLPNPRWKGPASPDASGQLQYVRDSDFYGPLAAMNFQNAFFAGNATLNRAFTWNGQRGDPSKITLDWTKEGQFSMPPTIEAVQACAALAADPTMFGRTGAYVPIFFDIEWGPPYGPDDNNPMYYGWLSSEPHRQQVIQNMVNTIEWGRAVNPTSAYYWFDFPAFDFSVRNEPIRLLKQQMLNGDFQPLAETLDGICVPFYVDDSGAEQNLGVLLDHAKEVRGMVKAHFPDQQDNIIATLAPCYFDGYPDTPGQRPKPKNESPLPMSVWKQVVDTVIGEGMDVALFSDLPMIYDAFAPHCQYLARKAGI